jgi:hypothetical protein
MRLDLLVSRHNGLIVINIRKPIINIKRLVVRNGALGQKWVRVGLMLMLDSLVTNLLYHDVRHLLK